MTVFHFVYKTVSPSGRFYIGRHSTKHINDGYLGSGKWVRSIRDKSKLVRVILEFCNSIEELLQLEEAYINTHINDPLCMNWNNTSCGAASGHRNPAHSEKERQRRSKFLKEHNPMHRPDIAQKVANKTKGRLSPSKGEKRSVEMRKRISQGRMGCKYSEEGRRKLSESRKRDYANGTRTPARGMLGKSHTEETKAISSQKALARTRVTCIHCGKVITYQNYVLWHGDNCKLSTESNSETVNSVRNQRIKDANMQRRAKRFGVEDMDPIIMDMKHLYRQGWSYRQIAEKYSCYGAGIFDLVRFLVKS